MRKETDKYDKRKWRLNMDNLDRKKSVSCIIKRKMEIKMVQSLIDFLIVPNPNFALTEILYKSFATDTQYPDDINC